MWVRKLFMERQDKGDDVLVKDLRSFDAEYFFQTKIRQTSDMGWTKHPKVF